MKNEYNRLIKEYHNVINELSKAERLIDSHYRNLSKNEKKQKLIFLRIDEEFSQHFTENLSQLPKEFADFLFSFFNLSIVSRELFTVSQS